MQAEAVSSSSPQTKTVAPGGAGAPDTRAARQERVRSIEDKIRAKLLNAAARKAHGSAAPPAAEGTVHSDVSAQFRAVQQSTLDASKFSANAPSAAAATSKRQPRPDATHQRMPGDEGDDDGSAPRPAV